VWFSKFPDQWGVHAENRSRHSEKPPRIRERIDLEVKEERNLGIKEHCGME